MLLTSEEGELSGDNEREEPKISPKKIREEVQDVLSFMCKSLSKKQHHCLWAGMLTSEEGKPLMTDGKRILLLVLMIAERRPNTSVGPVSGHAA